MIFSKGSLLLIIILKIILVSHLAHADSVNIPSLFVSLQAEGDPSTVWFDKGKTLYKIKAYREAAEAFSRIGKDAPQDIMAESLYLMANSLMKTRDYPEAMAAVDLIPVKSSFYIYGLYTKAMISLNLGKETFMLHGNTKDNESPPSPPFNKGGKGGFSGEKDAIEYLEQVSKNYPATQVIKNNEKGIIEGFAFKAHLTLGFMYLDRNNPVEALKHFSIIPKDSPFYMQALFGSGWAYADMERWVRTVVFWEELSYLYPDSKYAREVVPYIGHAYTTLSAYGKALEQNGIALQYYADLLKKIPDIERGIRQKDMEEMARAIEMIGDKGLTNELDLYYGLLSMEEYIAGIKEGVTHEVESLIKASKRTREGIVDRLSEGLLQGIENLRHGLLEASVNTSLEIAKNLRLEGGGQISNDMIFDGP